jgi:hypothetical protein
MYDRCDECGHRLRFESDGCPQCGASFGAPWIYDASGAQQVLLRAMRRGAGSR